MAGADTAAENSLVVIESSPDEEQEATPSQPARTRSFSINTADAKSSAAILSIIANERNWKECSTGTMGSIVWVVSPEALEQAMIRRKGDQRISHIPGMHCLCRKIPFARLMASFPFVPETFVLYPNENPSKRLLAALKAGPLILKPNDGTQGDGIHIVRTTSDLKRRQEYQKEPVVLQRYIARRFYSSRQAQVRLEDLRPRAECEPSSVLLVPGWPCTCVQRGIRRVAASDQRPSDQLLVEQI